MIAKDRYADGTDETDLNDCFGKLNLHPLQSANSALSALLFKY